MVIANEFFECAYSNEPLKELPPYDIMDTIF